MLASQIIARARSLSDTPNSLFISNTDEINSLWEAYKDLYAHITDSSDDYFLSEATLDLSTAVKFGDNAWVVSVPSDLYKIRFVDYYDTLNWRSMQKFATADRNKFYGDPRYRWHGDKLWIIGQYLPAQIKITYYPPPIIPSVPATEYKYFLSLPQYDKTKIASPLFVAFENQNNFDLTDYLFYVYNGLYLKVDSISLNTSVTLYTSLSTMSNIVYNLGYIYFLMGGDIYRAPTDFVSTIVPTQITTLGNIVSFSIVGDSIYFSNSLLSYTCDLDGTSVTGLYTYPIKGMVILSGKKYHINVIDDFIYENDTSLGILAQNIVGDGTHFYYLDLSGRVITDLVQTLAVGVQFLSDPMQGFFATITRQFDIAAISTSTDTDFVYPLNEANELLAYQCAIDFKRKQNGDTTALYQRYSEILSRFLDVLKRDEGLPERRTREVPFFNF